MRPTPLTEPELTVFRALLTALEECGEPETLPIDRGRTIPKARVRWERIAACYARMMPAPDGADDVERERHATTNRKTLLRTFEKLYRRGLVWRDREYAGRTFKPVAGFPDLQYVPPEPKPTQAIPRLRLVHSADAPTARFRRFNAPEPPDAA